MLRAKHFNPYLRERITRLSQHDHSPREIVKIIAEEENVHIHRDGVKRLLTRAKDCRHLCDANRSGRNVTFGDEIRTFIDQKMYENNELTGCQLSNIIKAEFNVNISSSTVNRIRNKLGWRPAHPKYCQIVRDVNKLKRIDFCSMLIQDINILKTVIFTDECCVQLERHKRIIWKKGKDELMVLRSRAKHPVKVHIWAGISWYGATDVIIMNEKTRINSQIYIDILRKGLIPFITKHFTDRSYIFQADSAPVHKSNETMRFITENNLNYTPIFWPPESPDLNAIENVWHEMKEYLRGTAKPNNLAELIQGILTFWSTVTPAKCRKYMRHIAKVIPPVLENKGGPTLH